MYRKKMKGILEKIVKNEINKSILRKYLINNFDYEKIYDCNEMIITDVFFSLKHYAEGEENIEQAEWIYLLECLEGKRTYNLEEKYAIQLEKAKENVHLNSFEKNKKVYRRFVFRFKSPMKSREDN